MNRIQVSSTDIRAIGFDASTNTLEIEFHSGGLYQYDNVPESMHSALMSAPSHGKFFHQFIRTQYSTRKLR